MEYVLDPAYLFRESNLSYEDTSLGMERRSVTGDRVGEALDDLMRLAQRPPSLAPDDPWLLQALQYGEGGGGGEGHLGTDAAFASFFVRVDASQAREHATQKQPRVARGQELLSLLRTLLELRYREQLLREQATGLPATPTPTSLEWSGVQRGVQDFLSQAALSVGTVSGAGGSAGIKRRLTRAELGYSEPLPSPDDGRPGVGNRCDGCFAFGKGKSLCDCMQDTEAPVKPGGACTAVSATGAVDLRFLSGAEAHRRLSAGQRLSKAEAGYVETPLGGVDMEDMRRIRGFRCLVCKFYSRDRGTCFPVQADDPNEPRPIKPHGCCNAFTHVSWMPAGAAKDDLPPADQWAWLSGADMLLRLGGGLVEGFRALGATEAGAGGWPSDASMLLGLRELLGRLRERADAEQEVAEEKAKAAGKAVATAPPRPLWLREHLMLTLLFLYWRRLYEVRGYRVTPPRLVSQAPAKGKTTTETGGEPAGPVLRFVLPLPTEVQPQPAPSSPLQQQQEEAEQEQEPVSMLGQLSLEPQPSPSPGKRRTQLSPEEEEERPVRKRPMSRRNVIEEEEEEAEEAERRRATPVTPLGVGKPTTTRVSPPKRKSPPKPAAIASPPKTVLVARSPPRRVASPPRIIVRSPPHVKPGKLEEEEEEEILGGGGVSSGEEELMEGLTGTGEESYEEFTTVQEQQQQPPAQLPFDPAAELRRMLLRAKVDTWEAQTQRAIQLLVQYRAASVAAGYGGGGVASQVQLEGLRTRAKLTAQETQRTLADALRLDMRLSGATAEAATQGTRVREMQEQLMQQFMVTFGGSGGTEFITPRM